MLCPLLRVLVKLEKCFLFHFKSSFYSEEDHSLVFLFFKFHNVIKCLSRKQEIHFTEELEKQTVSH